MAFVIMTFDDRLGPVYAKVIKPVLEQNGYECRRADEEHRIGAIIDQIETDIRRADLILCDLTFNNPNVFYEIGVAHAIGKRPILISQHGPDLPFDVRHLRVLTYVDDKYGLLDLREKLVDCLRRESLDRNVAGRAKLVEMNRDELLEQRAALSAPSHEARRWAIKYLASHSDSESFERIKHIAETDTHTDILRDAFTALFNLDMARAKQTLISRGLRYQSNALVRERVVELLGRYSPDKDLTGQLQDQADDSSWGVRRRVCEVLGRWQRGAAQLRTMLHDREVHVSLAAIEALSRFEPERLGTEAPKVKMEAADTLERIRTDEDVATMTE